MIYLVDFDKTISKQCSCATMIDHFATADTTILEQEWESGRLSTPQMTDKMLSILDMTEETLLQVIKGIEIDPYFPAFFNHCIRHQKRIAIVSDGYSLLIHSILKQYMIEDIQVYANELYFDNGIWKASFPYHSMSTPNLGVSKRDIIKKYQKLDHVTFIGDGYTDYQAAETADRVFAKDKLAIHCQKNGISYLPFQNFQDIIATDF
ncbi:hypothetical protein BHU72_08620 [Desulfuribacillus stibiiarsenatis]|uniref:2,3-diketo-5-methylthio-1-phosphopentane phosphatase n=1 Tax=Desulfuribacillus stibiiarsenatis TaxID=1390249 RepID=A0A1E5L3B0_9FIRM|nr:MtnX-like HAD-IB family phosphatase [Desulfuribacillus stibiiarsenatis]OEH84561.1 hypothetical protein BHU72_08620 [Desulfuribacillus stibiiarsenatis]